MAILIYLLMITISTVASLADELPGYPPDVLSKASLYECIEGNDITFKNAKGVPEALLYSVCVDKGFDILARNLIRQSMEKFLSKFTDSNTYSCLKRNKVLYGGGSAQGFKDFLETYVIPSVGASVTGRTISYVFISAMEHSEKTSEFMAEGYPNLFFNPAYSATMNKLQRHLSIGVRKDLVGSFKFTFGNDSDFWAAIFAVPVLRNLGILTTDDVATRQLQISATACFRWGSQIPVIHISQFISAEEGEL